MMKSRLLILIMISGIILLPTILAYDYSKSINNTIAFNDTIYFNITTITNDTLKAYSNTTTQHLFFYHTVIFNETDHYNFPINITVSANTKPTNLTQYVFINSTLQNQTVKNISIYLEIFNGTDFLVMDNFTGGIELIGNRTFYISLNKSRLPYYENKTLTIHSKKEETLTVYCDPFLICPMEVNLTPTPIDFIVKIEVLEDVAVGSYDRRLIFIREGNTTFIHFLFDIFEAPEIPIYYSEELEDCLYEHYYSEFNKSKEDRRFQTHGQATDFCYGWLYNQTMTEYVNVTVYRNRTKMVEVLKYGDVKTVAKEAFEEGTANFRDEVTKDVTNAVIGAIQPDLQQMANSSKGVGGVIRGLIDGQGFLKNQLNQSNVEREKLKKYKTGFWWSFWIVVIVLVGAYIFALWNYGASDA